MNWRFRNKSLPFNHNLFDKGRILAILGVRLSYAGTYKCYDHERDQIYLSSGELKVIGIIVE